MVGVVKAVILLLVVVCVGCASTPKIVPNSPEAKAAIRKAAKKPMGELAKADLEKVTQLILQNYQLTDVKGLEKLTKLDLLFSKTTPPSPRLRLMNCKRRCPSAKS
jgi:hypothetical protein